MTKRRPPPKHYLAPAVPPRGRAPGVALADCGEHPNCRLVHLQSGAVQHVAVRVVTEADVAARDAARAAQEAADG